jgi:phosphoribosylaminoimidazolecarboxamide formyltransferase/IMP cyclohydrolase
MHNAAVIPRRALLSVSNKTGLLEFAQQLRAFNIEIISTGGTCQLLREAKIPTREVSEVTQFPEMMDGRIKTLHPKIHGGILGLRDVHQEVARQQQIPWIDLVVVNLYPFAETIKKPAAAFDEAIENIDIGGPTLIRAAAKNMGWATVVVDPADYALLLLELNNKQSVSFATRRHLATKAFAYTAEYDALIEHYLSAGETPTVFPERLSFLLRKKADLRYGENPHQSAAVYQELPETAGILSAKQHQGKLLSYNNITDADAAVACVQEFWQPACVIVKHGNPCGVALAASIAEAFERAFAADALSAFGGIVALNRPCNQVLAQALSSIFMEVLIAPEYSPEALNILAQKPNLRVMELNLLAIAPPTTELKFIQGGLLVQTPDTGTLQAEKLKVVTQQQPDARQVETMLFAWQVLKHLKSNAILVAKDRVTVGVGTGQVSRIDAVDMALRKANHNLSGSILASDAFFPFRDSIDRVVQFSKTEPNGSGVGAIIQPGGSLKDEEVIQACNEYGIAMVFTGQRCFKH